MCVYYFGNRRLDRSVPLIVFLQEHDTVVYSSRIWRELVNKSLMLLIR